MADRIVPCRGKVSKSERRCRYLVKPPYIVRGNYRISAREPRVRCCRGSCSRCEVIGRVTGRTQHHCGEQPCRRLPESSPRMFLFKVMVISAIIVAVFFESIGGRSLRTQTKEATKGHSADCLDAVGLPAKEGYSVSKKYPCQRETCSNGSWVIQRCIEDVDPKCKGQLGTQGPGTYPECCAYAVACSGM